MNDLILEVEGIRKKFCRSLRRGLFYGSRDVLFTALHLPDSQRGLLRPGEFWALDDINFQVRKGESVGIMGRNGAGKTTLLRLIAGIYPPDYGKITVRGRIGSLIAVGAGFHPNMTGRENIFLNGAILGLTRSDIIKKMDEVIDFAEIPSGAIDAPVSTYSSGMTVRLGFSIATATDPDMLIVDEVLAVGDHSFQEKCRSKIRSYCRDGGSLLLVSHAEALMLEMCQRAVYLEDGKQLMVDDVKKVVPAYLKKENRKAVARVKTSDQAKNIEIFTDEISDFKIRMCNEQGVETNIFQRGECIIVDVSYRTEKEIQEFISVVIFYRNNTGLFRIQSQDYGVNHIIPAGKTVKHAIRIPHIHLNIGIYNGVFYLINQERDGVVKVQWPDLLIEADDVRDDNYCFDFDDLVKSKEININTVITD